MNDLLGMDKLVGRLPVTKKSCNTLPLRRRLPSDKLPSARRSPSGPTSPLSSGVKPKKKIAIPLKFIMDDPSSFKISDNLNDSCKTNCKICGKPFPLAGMRIHTVWSHGVQITKYKEMYGQFEIIEKVFHKCHLCGKVVLLDSDTLGAHIKRVHNMKERTYKKTFCIYKQAVGVKKAVVVKKSEVTKSTKGPLNALVGHLAKLEKEHSEEKFLTEERLSEQDKEPIKSFLNDSWVGEEVMAEGLGEEGMDVEPEEYLDGEFGWRSFDLAGDE